MDRRLILLLGGARSGKSSYAVQWARARGGSVLFVATAEPLDAEMQQRVARHRAERPATWTTLESTQRLGDAVHAALGTHETVIVDCLTLLVSNVLLALPPAASQDTANAAVRREVEGLLASYGASHATWLVISNEVGMGIVPPTALGRTFRDALGIANQLVAGAADEVQLLVAGLPLALKSADRR